MIIRLLTLITLILLFLPVHAAPVDTTASDKVNYRPEVHMTLRAGFQWNTETGQSRFMVRNARVSASGNALPWAGYLVQVDFCNLGKIRLLDAYLRLNPAERLSIIAGQTVLPFSLSGARPPRNYYFFNRGFPAKYFGTTRSAGIKAAYTLPGLPVFIEGGVFNSTSMTEHQQWNSHFTYSVRANLPVSAGVLTHVGFQSRVPAAEAGGARLNMFDAAVHADCGRLTLEAEYMMVHCTAAFPTAHLWEAFAAYRIPLKARLFNQLSIEGRVDGHSDVTDGACDEHGSIITTWAKSTRITVGSTISYLKGPVHLDFRVNYEQYFHGRNSAPSENSKLVTAVCLYY